MNSHRLLNRPFLSIVFLWLGAVAWRPFFLGFYSDDWVLLTESGTSPVSFSEYLWIHAPRPIYALFAWSINLCLRGNVHAWTLASAIIVLVTVLCLFRYLRFFLARLGIAGEYSSRGALFGSAVWLLSPLSVVETNWPTCTLTLAAFWFLALGTILIFDERLQRQVLGTLALAASFLTYEAYMLVFPITLLAIAAVERGRARKYLRPALLFLGAFVVMSGYKEAAKLAGFGDIHKSFNDAWPALFANNMFHLPFFLGQAFSPFRSLMYDLGGLFLLCVVALFPKARIRQALVLPFVVIAGYASSALLYAMVGYGFAGAGIMSRTMTGPLLYTTICLSGLFAIADGNADQATRYHKVRRAFLYGSALCLLVVLASANFVRSLEWVVLWERELTVLRSIPATTIERSLAEGPVPLVMIVQTENDPEGRVFGASYDLSGAVASYFPQFSPAIRRRDLVFLSARERVAQTRWDGARIKQRINNNLTEDFLATRVYRLFIREHGDATLSPFTAGRGD